MWAICSSAVFALSVRFDWLLLILIRLLSTSAALIQRNYSMAYLVQTLSLKCRPFLHAEPAKHQRRRAPSGE